MNVRRELMGIFAELTDIDEMEQFFQEMFTPKEISDLAMRWQLLKELHQGRAQRRIAAEHNISLCKITRGSKVLKKDPSITRRILDRRRSGDDH